MSYFHWLGPLTWPSPLGLRFWDVAESCMVATGLKVTAQPRLGLDSVVTRQRATSEAIPNGLGVYVFRHLPGLQRVVGTTAVLDLPSGGARPFVLTVSDTMGRFLPFTLEVNAPSTTLPDLIIGAPGMSWSPEGTLPLFSTVSRTFPPALAAVRAQLVDAATDQPATWAVMKLVAPDGEAYYGVSDEHGSVAVALPFPEPAMPIVSGSPIGNFAATQSWPLELTVYHRPDLVDGQPPALASLLSQTAQPAGSAFQALSPPTRLARVTLEFGRDLVIRSTGRSELLISSTALP